LWQRLSLAAIVCVAAVVAVRPAPTAAALAVRIAATANFGGNYADEQWVPITIALANDGPGVTGEAVVEVQGSDPPLRFTQRVELPTRSQKVLTLYAQVPTRISAVNVRFEAGKETVLAPPVTLRDLRSGQGLVGVIVDDATAGAELTRAVVSAYGTTSFEAITVAPDEITANTFGLGSFAALIVGDASTGRWSAEQRKALADWVARGGQLVVAGGPNWRKSVEGLGELPPLRPNDSRTVADLAGLAGLGNGTGPTGQAVLATGDLLAGAARLADQDGAPLVASRGWGHGTVTSLAFDPASGALSSWSGATSFWRKLALDTPVPVPLQAPFNAASYSGSSNYSGNSQVIDVLRDIPGLALPPTWLLGLILFFFILAIGPANYLVLRAIDRRELAWVTIPVLTLVFAGTIYAVGTVTKGRSLVLNSVSIVRVSPGARSAEVAAFYGIFTPSRGVRDVDTASEALVLPYSRSGLGDNEELGSDVRLTQGAGSGVHNASFAQWTQRTIAAQGTVEPQAVALDVALRWEGRKLVGTVTNRTQVAVEDGLIVYDGAYQSIGALAPGASATVDWLPSTTSSTGYGRGLGTVYYNGGQYQNNQPGSLGITGRRANTLDALSGSVIDYRGRGYSSAPTPTPTATATRTPTPTPRAGTPRTGTPGVPTPTATRRSATPTTGSSNVAATNAPVQVLFWRNDLPLELKISAGERHITTLVIQETYPGAATQSAPSRSH
jgi:hypothetical protein